MQIARYYHTLRYLKWSQIYWRLFYKVVKTVPDLSEPPNLRAKVSSWVKPIDKQKKLIGEQSFNFLNETHEIFSESDWNNNSIEKLWLYNLHYFDDLCAVDAKIRYSSHAKLISRWIAENIPGYGNGWEPYPLSLRICNWIKWALSGNKLHHEWIHSLAIQVRYLRNKLEWHLLGNHLFSNAKALVFAGLFFEGKEADSWLQKGLAILDLEISEQVLEDGGNFELSTMYHAIFLEDLLDVINVLRCYGYKIPPKLDTLIPLMFCWMKAMTHSDGEISFFNDAAHGIAAKTNELNRYVNRLSIHLDNNIVTDLVHLKSSGYVHAENNDALLIMDVAPIGPDYLPGHAHADTLSIEFSLFKNRIIVNSGTSCYGTSEERLRQRSTSAHSTVEINGENSSEVWGGFRVARRARPIGAKSWRTNSDIHISCAHDGYQRLVGKPIHQREVVLGDKSLVIVDRINGHYDTAVGRLYLHPLIIVELSDNPVSGKLKLPDGKMLMWQVKGCEAQIKKSTYHPEFGKSIENHYLELTFKQNQSEVILSWN